ncbi:diguanylate cyclase [Ochrobactrum vermis]|uniref:Diguanylate cyclase n=1 Tax=Ochrobactrum vermis TaxID=1827297 RepID=A0ABU8PDX9_9HYPH|nr:diguanylate cyclase [Ochrobactrum vermis]PQZ30780.1 diguanylate cyclase [Ochrobactrum vermis]
MKGLADQAAQGADENNGNPHPAEGTSQPSQLKVGDNAPVGTEQLDWLVAMINHVPDFIYAKDLQGRFLFANDAVVRNNGLSDINELIGLTDFDIHGEAAITAHISEIEKQVMESGQPDLGYEERAMRGGTDRWLMISRVPLRDRNGNIIGVVGASRDISLKKKAERFMQVQARILEMTVSAVAIPDFVDQLTRLLEGLAAGIRCVAVVTGETAEDVVISAPSLPSLSFGVRNGREPLSLAALEAVLKTLVPDSEAIFSMEIPSADGQGHGALGFAVNGDASDDRVLTEFFTTAARMSGIAIDRRIADERIRYLAEHDTLTGLANRAFLERKLGQILEQAAAHSQRVAVGFLDLDQFKPVNDTLGHAAGDKLLQQIAGRISLLLRDGELAGRMGGDEFILVLQADDGDFCSRLDEIRRKISEPVELDGTYLEVTCSIGVACFPKHGRSAAELFAAADAAMYDAKAKGRNGVSVYSVEMSRGLASGGSKQS